MRAYIALVKWRNQLLALFCLLAFAGLGVLYFQHWVIRKPFGIILFVVEGLAPDRLAPTRAYAGGAGTHLSLDSMPHVALLTNYSKDFATPDQAAAATAIATGSRVPNGAIAMNGDKKPIPSIIEFANQVEERGQQPSLSDMVRRAIQLLQYNPGGYLLVVDAGLMRKAAQENNGERTLMQTVELDRAVALARRYAGQKSTIIVCGDVAIGGMNLNGFPFREDSGIALLGLNSAGQPWITWATGPHSTRSYGTANIPNNTRNEQLAENLEPAALYTKSALPTVDDVVVFGSGPGTDVLQGVVDSTAVFKLLRGEL